MKIYRFFVVLIVVLYSSVHATSGGGNPQDQVMACVQKLMPCQPYLHKLNPPPPASCCGPMKEMVEKDSTCLCAVFNNPEILKTLNLTKENAPDLPNACGAHPNVSLCTAASSSPTASPGSTTKASSSAPALNFIGFSFVSAFVAVIFF